MSYNITQAADGSAQINSGRPGYTVNPPMRNDATGEFDSYEPEVTPLFDDNFDRFDAFDALPPDYQQREEVAGNPFTDPSSTEADIRAWVLTPGQISPQQLNAILEGMEQNQASDNTRDLISELISLKEGSIGIDDLSEAALEFLDVDTPENSTPADEILDSLSEDAQRQLEQVDPEEMNDLRATGNDLLTATPDPSQAEAYNQAAEQCYQTGDSEGALLYALNSAFNSGQLTAKEAVTTAIQKMGLSRAYNALLRLQQGDPDSIEYGYSRNSYDNDTFDTDY